MGKGNFVVVVLAVTMLTIVGILAFAFLGPNILKSVVASVSTSVPTAPENQNSGILSTPTVAVIPTEILVPTVVETPKPLPTETSVPSPTPTAVATVDPDKAWPEFVTGTPEARDEYPVMMDAISKDLYGIKGEYFHDVTMIEEFEGGFKVHGKYPENDMYIKITGSDADWIYMEVNSVKLKVRPGTIMYISSVTFPGPVLPWDVGFTAFVMFDPAEQKFASDSRTGEINLPLSTYFVVLRPKGVIEIGYLVSEQVFGSNSREDYCEGLFNDNGTTWEWGDSSIVHDSRFEGCPYVEEVK
jgi:hypothetical protein